MKKKEIIKNNNLIAEFLGWKINDIGFYGYYRQFDKFLYNPASGNNRSFHPEQLAFHESWDWIMIAYKKLSDELDNLRKKIKSNKKCSSVNKIVRLKHIDDCDASIRCAIWGVRIEDTFYGISETIKWCNKQKLKR